MKKFELPEQPQKTNTSNDFTVAKEAIANLDKFDYAWKTYSHKIEKRFTAAIKYIEELEARLKEWEGLRIGANNEAAKEYALKCEVVEERAALKREIEKLKSQLDSQQPEIPEVPPFVADWIEYWKSSGRGVISIDRALTQGSNLGTFEKIHAWLDEYDEEGDEIIEDRNGVEPPNVTLFSRAWVNGYTVAKVKRFYLKHKSVIVYDCNCGCGNSDTDELYLMADGNFAIFKVDAYKFTQSEIDSMETGSYEQIEVEE